MKIHANMDVSIFDGHYQDYYEPTFDPFFRLTDVKEVYARNEFATLEITLVLKRNDPYYTLTWFVPIMVLTFLTPIGLILPGEYLIYFR